MEKIVELAFWMLLIVGIIGLIGYDFYNYGRNRRYWELREKYNPLL